MDVHSSQTNGVCSMCRRDHFSDHSTGKAFSPGGCIISVNHFSGSFFSQLPRVSNHYSSIIIMGKIFRLQRTNQSFYRVIILVGRYCITCLGCVGNIIHVSDKMFEQKYVPGAVKILPDDNFRTK